MSYPIERKLVVGISSNALFDLSYEDNLFETQGVEAYRKYQLENREKLIDHGLAYPFIRRFLAINDIYTDESPVEVVLLSKNSPETGIRIFKSIQSHDLNISRAVFTSGQSPYKYIPAYNISLFLSTNNSDVSLAMKAGFAAGCILQSDVIDDPTDKELRVAFDFDGVIIDDEAEKVYQNSDLSKFHQHEEKNVFTPHEPGPLADFFKKLSFFQKLEARKKENDPNYEKILRTGILTARNAPSHERIVTTLEHWGVSVDDMFLTGGVEKKRILEVLKPHLFLDDQKNHLDDSLKNITLVHVPFGVTNKITEE